MSLFSRSRSGSVASLGEGQLITSISRWLGSASLPPPHGIGDDCAVFPASKKQQLVTVDPVIYGKHFDDRVSPRDAGAKLLKRNLSDIAAMGGTPTSAVLALSLDPRTKLAWLEAFYRGLAACARKYGVKIIGGDIAQAEGTFSASLTLLGNAPNSRVLTRQGAQRGDSIYVTGRLGGSLKSGHHFSFKPRLAEGAWLAQKRAVIAMMDISDGLGKDIRALTPSGTKPSIDEASLPLNKGCDPQDALNDGEDYELLFVVKGKANHGILERKWRQTFPRTPLTKIGKFIPETEDAPNSLNLECYFGYEHLR